MKKTNDTNLTPNQYTTFHYFSFFIKCNDTLPTLCSKVQNLATSKIWPFCTQKPKNANLTISLLMHYHWPGQIQQNPKDPILKFILTMKLLCTFDRHCLEVICFGHRLSVPQISLSSFNSATSSHHLKRTSLFGGFWESSLPVRHTKDNTRLSMRQTQHEEIELFFLGGERQKGGGEALVFMICPWFTRGTRWFKHGIMIMIKNSLMWKLLNLFFSLISLDGRGDAGGS